MRAFWNTFAMLGTTLLGKIADVLTIGISILYGFRETKGMTRKELANGFWKSLKPVLIVFVVVFCFSFAITTYYDHMNLVSANASLKSSNDILKHRNEEKDSRIQALTGQVNQRQKIVYKNVPSTPPITQSGNAQNEIARLQKQLDDRDALDKNRRAVAMLLEQGNAIANSCLAKTEIPELNATATDWAKRTYGFLNAIDTAFGARFSAASGLSYSHEGVPHGNDQIWN
jgi:hypothetical protein